MPTNQREDIDADYMIRNNTKSDYVFATMTTKEKTVMRAKAVDGKVVEVEDSYEVEEAGEQIHLPPTVNQRDPGMVPVTEEEYEQLEERTNIRALIDEHILDLDRA